MSKSSAVAKAIDDQLTLEAHVPFDLNKVMGKDYRYDLNGMTLFLAAVAKRLENGVPKWNFEFNTAFAISALQLTVGVLIGKIISETTP